MKHLAYIILPVLALALAGVGIASAHGWFSGFSQVTPEEIVQKQETMFQQKAEFLGISLDEIKDAWAEGKSFRGITEEQGITQEQLQERIKEEKQEQFQARLQAMVDNGVISQEQANKRLQFMEERMVSGEINKDFRKGFGRCFDW